MIGLWMTVEREKKYRLFLNVLFFNRRESLRLNRWTLAAKRQLAYEVRRMV